VCGIETLEEFAAIAGESASMADIAQAEKIIAPRFSYGQEVIHRRFNRISHALQLVHQISSALISASISLARSRSNVF
jgi:hypothetical protein